MFILDIISILIATPSHNDQARYNTHYFRFLGTIHFAKNKKDRLDELILQCDDSANDGWSKCSRSRKERETVWESQWENGKMRRIQRTILVLMRYR